MWQHIVDASTGQILRRSSRTSFQKPLGKKTTTSNFGTPGGGVGVGRQPTLRPDLQDIVEAYNDPNGTARGKVFDTIPTLLAGERRIR